MDEDVSKEPRDVVTGGPRDGCIAIAPDGDLPTFHIQIYDPIYSYPAMTGYQPLVLYLSRKKK
jgi:hypothetical protein